MAAEPEPRWITYEEVCETQLEQLDRFGGIYGIKDEGLVESAVFNPINAYLYEGETDILALAIRLGAAIARNHGFNDGNKRTAAVSLLTFLRANGFDLDMPDDTLLGRMLEAVLCDDMTEEEFADHIIDNIAEL
ncbi:MAG TPA: type II toxin-antitoxin system death-on-curing family toxin [Sphingomonas sp.]|uniref:type II toxin-antitoxin system death-on-curing family toxin n=1 Tax=Sphingomonas sp. TaxID=28214 RepID=UPI002BF38E40|nr:type II toxin-antitoxin system death-on-curing family toxin [Sphingomonas sp.]HMI20099.1 type II toxin-antitoxin system death-on-curing family toxin [Sphingomonas sp.]